MLDELFFSMDSIEVIPPSERKKKADIILDIPPYPEVILRLNGISCYLAKIKRKKDADIINFRLEGLIKSSEKIITDYYDELKKEILKKGYDLSKTIINFEKRLKCIGCLKTQCNAWAETLFSLESGWSELYIKNELAITKDEEGEIIELLNDGAICVDRSPSNILHCYYEAYRQSKGEERPNYAATIHSLAFNEFDKNKKKRR